MLGMAIEDGEHCGTELGDIITETDLDRRLHINRLPEHELRDLSLDNELLKDILEKKF